MRQCSLVLLAVLAVAASTALAEDGRRDAVRVALEPVVTGGLSSPVYITHSRDGSGRLFIVEQTGRIRILCGCTPELRVFLDVSSKIVSGGEQGLLGLAFHPSYKQNRRFFVNYTRRGDGATVVSEFRASATDPLAADPAETVLLTISQPFTNHNGGMIEFGLDGYLYIGMGDGGSGNDPGNRAQNTGDLLGKMLRIDVDRQGVGTPYAIPPDNPYVGSGNGRPEIFAVGLRNPWRFSFDRATGRLYAGDVGQGQVEEVTIVSNGGNLGWRVLEGNRCTGLGPASCTAPGFVPPIATYTHSQGRCSITGGYVYRGRRGSLPLGSYVYGDYCTGEVFLLNAGTQTVLADTGYSISSFGEDESGELYVVGHGGTIHRIVNAEAPAASTAYFPYLRADQGSAGGSDEFTGVAITNHDSVPATLTFRAYSPDGALVQGADVTNPRTLELRALAQTPLVATQIFGGGLPAAMPDGWMRLEGSSRQLTSFFLTFDSRLALLDGTPVGADTLTRFVMADTGSPGTTQIRVANPGVDSVQLDVELVGGNGTTKGSVSRSVSGHGVLVGRLRDLFPAATEQDYLRFTAAQGVVPMSVVFEPGRFARALPGLDATGGGTRLYCPQYVVGGGYRSELYVVNLDDEAGDVTLRLFGDDGTPLGSQKTLPISRKGKLVVSGAGFFGAFGGVLTQGFVEVRSSGIRLAGNVVYGDVAGEAFSAALPLVTETAPRLVFGQVASDATYYTGVAIVNPGAEPTAALLEVFDGGGATLGTATVSVPALGRVSGLLTEFLPALAGTKISSGSIRLTGEGKIAAFAVFGTNRLDTLSAIPGTRQ